MVAMAGADSERPVAVKERLEVFGARVLADAMSRPVQMVNGGLYLRGLIEQGQRKSLEPRRRVLEQVGRLSEHREA